MAITVGVMEPLRAEHRELLPHLDELGRVAAAMVHGSPKALATELANVLDFLQHDLLPHAAAEDEVLYPAVERAMRAPGATETMRREHREVARMIAELAAAHEELGLGLGPDLRGRLTALLYGLHAVVALHFAKEEELYLPLLDARLDADQARSLFTEMEAAAARHR